MFSASLHCRAKFWGCRHWEDQHGQPFHIVDLGSTDAWKEKYVSMLKLEGNMIYLSIMAMAVGLFIRFFAVSIVRRLLPSLLIDSIWGGGSMKEAANDST